jgi:hypothetical protein
VFHAIVSVMAVNIQFNSPRGVFLSFSAPGMLSTRSAGQSPTIKGFYTNKLDYTRVHVLDNNMYFLTWI